MTMESSRVDQWWGDYLEHLPISFYVVDRDFNLVYFHDYPQSISYEETPLKCYKFLYKNDEPCGECLLRSGVKIEEPRKFLLQLSTNVDVLFPLTYNYSVIPIKSDLLSPRYLMYRNDFSETHLVQKHISQLERFAINGALSSGIIHEANNMIMAIIGLFEILDLQMDDGCEVDVIRERIRQARSELKSLGSLLNNMHSLGRSSTSQKGKVSLSKVINDVFVLLRKKLRDKRVNLLVDVEPENVEIIGNEAALKQLLMNLVLNCHQALKADGTMKIRLRLLDEVVQLLVLDDGEGIDPDRLSQIFAPFYTSHTEQGGTGLGLFTSLKITEDHGGYIDFISQPGVGTATFVVLPRGCLTPCWEIKNECTEKVRKDCTVYERQLVTQCWDHFTNCPPADMSCHLCEVWKIKNRLATLPSRPSSEKLTIADCWEL